MWWWQTTMRRWYDQLNKLTGLGTKRGDDMHEHNTIRLLCIYKIDATHHFTIHNGYTYKIWHLTRHQKTNSQRSQKTNYDVRLPIFSTFENRVTCFTNCITRRYFVHAGCAKDWCGLWRNLWGSFHWKGLFEYVYWTSFPMLTYGLLAFPNLISAG